MKKILKYAAVGMTALLFISGCGKEAPAAPASYHAVTHANWNPFEYMKQGQITGFDVELLAEAARRAGVQITLSDAGWEAIFEQLRSHQADLAISGITITAPRKESYQFSKPYFLSRQAILIKDGTPISSAKDLMDGKTIVVQNGSTGQEALEKLMEKNNPAIKKTPMSVQMLINGQADALVGDETSVLAIKAQYPEANLKVVYDDSAFAAEEFGIMYPKDADPALREKLDAALSEMIKDGTYANLYKKWFHADPPDALLAKLSGKG